MTEQPYTDAARAITRIGSSILVALPTELTDDRIQELRQAVADSAYSAGVTGAILNFARVNMMDSYIFHVMRELSKTVALMGVRVVWTGLTPGVVCALVDLGVPLNDRAVVTVQSLDQGLAYLSQPGGA